MHVPHVLRSEDYLQELVVFYLLPWGPNCAWQKAPFPTEPSC
ncbi:rCG26284 [Rattus norvegicus]|uniref:RCG26284 n=1 Tax=Rattus norvegicus TaxID=10116 RepID=A6HN69_RAT|nr:rCG26284 [Rattus norvegicus]